MSIEELLRETLDERATRVAGDDDLGHTVISRARGRRGRLVFLGLSALVVVVIVVVLTIVQTAPRNTAVLPDPRATATPSVSPPTPAASISGTYRVVQGPQPGTKATNGVPISVMPRIEVRGTSVNLVTPRGTAALPLSVNGARSIQAAGSNWVVFTVSSDYTGGDTDPGAQILIVSSSGAVRALVTDDVRSVAVSPDGTQVASVETVETRTVWSVTLVVRRIADGGVVRKVSLPYGSRGEWPYDTLVWTSDGILASNQSGSTTVAGATVLVKGTVVTDLAPITGIYRVASSTDLFVTVSTPPETCLSDWLPAAAPVTILCGHLGDVTPLGKERVLVQVADSNQTQAVLADTTTGTVALLTVPPALQQVYLNGLVADTATSVLVPDSTTKSWWRWDVVANTVEAAPLPDGAKAAISW